MLPLGLLQRLFRLLLGHVPQGVEGGKALILSSRCHSQAMLDRAQVPTTLREDGPVLPTPRKRPLLEEPMPVGLLARGSSGPPLDCRDGERGVVGLERVVVLAVLLLDRVGVLGVLLAECVDFLFEEDDLILALLRNPEVRRGPIRESRRLSCASTIYILLR